MTAAQAKNGLEREVALGDVAVGILEGLKPEIHVPELHVFRKPNGEPLGSIDTWWNSAVAKVWKPSKPSERRPRFHDLRKSGATRVEAVSSHAVAKRFLGRADEDVTDGYIVATLDAVRDAVNRAAALIDGDSQAVGGTVSKSESR